MRQGCAILFVIVMFFVLWSYSGWLATGFLIFLFLGLLFATRNFRRSERTKFNNNVNNLNAIKAKLREKGFMISKGYSDNNLTKKILLDHRNKNICLIRSDSNYYKIYKYSDILESEIIIDGESLTKTSRTSQIAGVIVGGLALGGVGAVVGGLSGKKTTSQEVVSMDLKIIINDTSRPVFKINFLKAELDPFYSNKYLPINKKSKEYRDAKSRIEHWHSLISVLIWIGYT